MIWKTIKQKPNYEVSELGEVRNRKTGRILKISTRKDGYCQVMLGGKTMPLYIHRIIAEEFIPNPQNLPQVDHINGIKSDNRIENLRWIDATGNYMASGYRNRIKNKQKPVRAIHSLTGEVLVFNSRNRAAKRFDCHTSQIKYNYIYQKGNKKHWYFELVEDIV
ncbi:MAG: NUMOD4 motif-containing HNH endonuclease [Peptostreptococcaceae bacterium]|nr:NUMOD4 motif-containing HNH endonuclease [Peptostreptococcaceae bacterium]